MKELQKKTPLITSKAPKFWGQYELIPIQTGFFGLDGGAMFGTVPQVLWRKDHPPDDKNRIRLQARTLALKSKERLVLIDCGLGGHFLEKYGEKLGSQFTQRYAIEKDCALVSALANRGWSPEAVTDVVLTHLHFDHAGGATKALNGNIVPTFPNARYYIQEENLDTARKPNQREKASYFPVNFEPLMESGQVTLLKGETKDFLPGISVTLSHGHTRGQQIVHIEECAEEEENKSKKKLVYCADLIPTRSHVRLAWIMGYDLFPLTIIEEKRNLLNQASKGNWMLFFEHDPDVDMAQVKHQDKDFAVHKIFSFTKTLEKP